MEHQTFTYWRPNTSVVKFFEALRDGTITRPTPNSMKITSTSPPTSDGYSTPVAEYKKEAEKRERSLPKSIKKRKSTTSVPPKVKKSKNSVESDLEDAYF